MQREFLAAPQFWTVGQTIDHVRESGDHLPELFFDVYVVDPSASRRSAPCRSASC
jgi:magnesium transporter